MKYILSIALLSAFILFSCSEDKIEGEIEDLRYTLPQGDSEAEIYARDFHAKFGSYILFEYDTMDYRWDMNYIHPYTYSQQKDLAQVKKGIDLFELVFVQQLPSDFLKEYGPYKIMFADSIWKDKKKEDLYWAHTGIDFLSIGNANNRIDALSSDSLKTICSLVQSKFFGLHLQKYDHFKLQDDFFNASKGFYDVNLNQFKTKEEHDNGLSPDPRRFGFWEKIDNQNNSYTMSPDKSEDIEQFVRYIIKLPKDEMDKLLNQWPLLKQKYSLLIKNLKDTYKIDLEAIRDTNLKLTK